MPLHPGVLLGNGGNLHPLLVYACENIAAMPLRLGLSLPIALVLLLTVGGSRLTHDPLLLALFPRGDASVSVETLPRGLLEASCSSGPSFDSAATSRAGAS